MIISFADETISPITITDQAMLDSIISGTIFPEDSGIAASFNNLGGAYNIL